MPTPPTSDLPPGPAPGLRPVTAADLDRLATRIEQAALTISAAIASAARDIEGAIRGNPTRYPL